jgi:hypothetical protein
MCVDRQIPNGRVGGHLNIFKRAGGGYTVFKHRPQSVARRRRVCVVKAPYCTQVRTDSRYSTDCRSETVYIRVYNN